jgi:hypothetical protein
VNDKINSKFIFPAICQEKSFIPLEVFRAAEENDNIVEAVHGRVNREGTQLSLAGGISIGKEFDFMKMKLLQVCFIIICVPKLCSLPSSGH